MLTSQALAMGGTTDPCNTLPIPWRVCAEKLAQHVEEMTVWRLFGVLEEATCMEAEGKVAQA